MDSFQRTIKLLDECDVLVKSINENLKRQIKEAEDELLMLQAERAVNERHS